MAEDATTKKDNIDKIKTSRINKALAALQVCGKTINKYAAATLYDELALMATLTPLWAKDPYNKLFLKQLAFTIIVPGGKASKAAEAIKVLEGGSHYFDSRYYLKPDAFGYMPITPTVANALRPLMRFPNQKIARLNLAFLNYKVLVAKLTSMDLTDTVAVHKLLMKNVNGFGAKAAAHFMRNTGLQTLDSTFIPIVDTHVMKFVKAAFPFELFRLDRFPIGMPPPKYDIDKQWAKVSQKTYGDYYVEYCNNTGANPLLLDAYLWCAYSNTTVPESIDFGGFK